MKTVVVRGPVFTKSGYGEHTRCILRALMEKEELFDIYLTPTIWGNTGWRYDDTEENDKFKHYVSKFLNHKGTYDLSLQVCIPNEWSNMADVNIGVTAAIETTSAPATWVNAANYMDDIIVVSEHAKRSLISDTWTVRSEDGQDSQLKCETSIDVIGYPVKTHNTIDLDLGLSTSFNFLTIAQLSPRKNMSATIRSFLHEFKDDPDVGLVMKVNKVNDSLLDKVQVMQEIKNTIAVENLTDIKCKIYVLHGPMTEQEIHSLYKHKNIHAYISTTHGEGYGLPLFEAAYSGMPVIATAWSGHLDFLYMPEENKVSKKVKSVPMFSKIRCDINKVQEEVVSEMIHENSKWAFVDLKACRKVMRHMLKTHKAQKSKAMRLKEYLHEAYSTEKIHKKIINSITKNFSEEEFSVDSWLEKMETDLEVNE